MSDLELLQGGLSTYSLEEAIFDKDLQDQLVRRFEVLSGFGMGVVPKELKSVSGYLEEDVTPYSLADFWNNNRDQIEQEFTYNPVSRHHELPGPDENRIDATFFSILLASVIKKGDVVYLNNPDQSESPLADSLGAFVQEGLIIIKGPTGDGVAHHAGENPKIWIEGDTGENLGFKSAPKARIVACDSVGKYLADNVIR